MTIETDYLIVGAGAAGMAFADALVPRSDADVVLVDSRHRPGGHWNDDYAFVRLHQPSAYYGVDSLPLGEDRIDAAGPNAGFYERATGAEVCDYFSRVLTDQLLPTGRARFFGLTDYMGEQNGEHTLVSRLTGQTTTVRVRRRVVDATYIATTIPSQHSPSFTVDPDVRFVAPNDLVRLGERARYFTIVGAGKTSMDTCCWLVEQGVDPGAIRWIRTRDPWIVDRSWMQPLAGIASMSEWLARQVEASAEATGADDLLDRLEEKDYFRRLDPRVRPSVFRGATLSQLEQDTIASITDVVRMGRVLHIGTDEVKLQDGSIPVRADEVFVDCSATGLGTPPTRPIFGLGRITLQRVQAGVDPFSAALIGVIESSDRSDDERNRLCPPNRMTGEAQHVARDLLITIKARTSWMSEPDVAQWFGSTRLNPFRGAAEHMTAEARASVKRMFVGTGPAIENLERIVGPDLA